MTFDIRRRLFRRWSYFRIGYGTYFALLVRFGSNIIVIDKLAVADNKYLTPFFTSLSEFTVVALIVSVPFSIMMALYHMKRTRAFLLTRQCRRSRIPTSTRSFRGMRKKYFCHFGCSPPGTG